MKPRRSAYREGIGWKAYLELKAIAVREYREATGTDIVGDTSIWETDAAAAAARESYEDFMNMLWKAYKPAPTLL